MSRRWINICGLILLWSCYSCGDNLYVAEIPPANFDDIFINLDLPAYQDLEVLGYQYIQADGGSNGIILYKVSSTNYHAYEATCSYDPLEAQNIVVVDPSGTSMVHYACSSYFTLQNGEPLGGPAFTPLRQYVVDQVGRTLTITDSAL